jgi:drug/metabolite transporter (DMT)-like permease
MAGKRLTPILQALASALLFGASAPLSKLLLGSVEPIPLAALLYLGSGFGLLLLRLLLRSTSGPVTKEARIRWSDAGWLTGAVLAGGVAAPILLMFGLRSTPASTASLLLNFEAVSTTMVAAFVFKESVGRRIWFAVGAITAACILLSWNPLGAWGFSLGATGVLLACVLWGVDNNLTRRISEKDPLSIVTIKGIASGTVSLCLAISTGSALPSPGTAGLALLLGFFSYGLSIVLFILALRGLGAARASAVFSGAPFAGALLAFFLFRDAPGALLLIALPLLVLGFVLVVGDGHGHLHRHELVVHEHRHVHDDGHHAHGHEENEGGAHSHVHVHEPIAHAHPHAPDPHHRHAHEP